MPFLKNEPLGKISPVPEMGVHPAVGGGYGAFADSNACQIIAITSSLVSPSTLTRFCDEVAPLLMLTFDLETPRTDAIAACIALFALPSTGGARIWHEMLLRHSLYPDGKRSFLAPALTSIEMITPVLSSSMASLNMAISGRQMPNEKEGVARY
jgi:hypothetical protein